MVFQLPVYYLSLCEVGLEVDLSQTIFSSMKYTSWQTKTTSGPQISGYYLKSRKRYLQSGT